MVADVVGELGWRRINLGLEFRRMAGVGVDDSLPFIVTPAEAGLLAECAGARRVFDRTVFVGQGGSWDTRDASSSGQDAIARFRAYYLAPAEVLGDILDVAPLTLQKVRGLLDRMDGITAEFTALFASHSDECASLGGLYADLQARISAELEAAVPGRRSRRALNVFPRNGACRFPRPQ